jgi:hypothetical protein
METSIPLWVTIAVALSSGLFALLGALGGQLISGRANFRMKKLELLYGRKADAYRDLLVNAGTFAHDPWNEEKYLAYLTSYLTALTVASHEVEHALNGKTGVSVTAQRLRTNRNYDEMIKVQSGPWYNAMKTASKAIQDDLQRLARD